MPIVTTQLSGLAEKLIRLTMSVKTWVGVACTKVSTKSSSFTNVLMAFIKILLLVVPSVVASRKCHCTCKSDSKNEQ